MVKNLILVLSALLIIVSCKVTLTDEHEKIEQFIAPFGEFNFQRPQFPDKSVNITKFGAKEGGVLKNTTAINDAIKHLSEAGGGMVVVPEGKWLTGPIVLLSNINLHLEEGAELLFSQDFDDYLPAVLTNWEGSEVYSYSPFIYAFGRENIAITGKGTLDGRGKPWWKQRSNGEHFRRSNALLKEMNENEVPVSERKFGSLERFLPPVFFGPLYCKNILIEGVTFKYGAFWTINPSFCDNIIIRRIYILTNGEYGDTPNGDGINPNSCSNVLIEYNTLDTGDDCITIKSGRDKDGRRIGIPCKNILIRHNTGLQGHGGIVIGSEMSGGVENVYAHDCRFNGTDRMIRIKTARGRGGYVKNCWFKDIAADTIEREAIRINMMYTGGDRLPAMDISAETPVIMNLNYENIQCAYSKRNVIQIIGLPEMPVKNVTLKNLQLAGRSGVEISDAGNISLDSLAISCDTGPLVNIMYSDSISFSGLEMKKWDETEVPIILKETNNLTMGKVSFHSSNNLISILGDSKNIIIDSSVPSDKIQKEKSIK